MLVRCSAIGKIMTNSRGKTWGLSATCKKYIQKTLLEDMYGVKSEFKSKYTDKGNEMEEAGISLANEVLDLGFLYKNKERFTNEYLTGEPDINTDVLIDIKSSWSMDTFPLFEEKIPTKDYYYQLMGYMMLTGKKVATLCYCLTDTPKHLLREDEKELHQFGLLPKELRIKTFTVEYDDQVAEEIIERVKQCKEYYNELKEQLNESQTNNPTRND